MITVARGKKQRNYSPIRHFKKLLNGIRLKLKFGFVDRLEFLPGDFVLVITFDQRWTWGKILQP